MTMPVGSEMQRLTRLFAGTWTGEETLYPSAWDPDGGSAFGTWIVKPDLDGCCLLVDYTEERDGTVAYRGHGVHGWDPEAGAFLAYWFDNIGVMPKAPARATLDGNRYSYSDTSPMGQNRMTYTWSGDVFDFRIELSADGGVTWTPTHEGRYTRAAGG